MWLPGSLLLLLLLSCLTGGHSAAVVTSSDLREAAGNSQRLAAELTVILRRVQAGELEGDREDIIRKLTNKIETLEEELELSRDSRQEELQEEERREDQENQEEGDRTRDDDKRNRIAKFREMLREFYLGAAYVSIFDKKR